MCDENDSKTEKLTSTISELQQLLREASEQYGDLETMNKQIMLEHQEEIEKKNDCIQLLRKELKDANDLLKAAKEGTRIVELFLRYFRRRFYSFCAILLNRKSGSCHGHVISLRSIS